ncbi:MAG: AmmeMemoRadiSam system protein B [Nannocystaceae bacterium]|nr:AmmeMemoRadiSam system protein B [Nannocystaceae bacterium]
MERPKLRNVERIPLQRGGESLLVLRDPLGLSPPLALDAAFAPLLDGLDGRKSVAQLRQSLAMIHGLRVDAEDLDEVLAELADAGLLDDDRFRERWAEAHEAFLAADSRAPVLADVLYPAEPAALRELLTQCVPRREPVPGQLRALLLPHAPLELAGATVAAGLAALPPAASLDAIVLLGADHHPGLLPFAATDRPYRTPLGTTTVAQPLLAALQRRLPWIDREAIRHRSAHSLEWAVLYLQHAWGDAMPPMVPLLCGPTAIAASGTLDAAVGELVATLEALLEDARVLVVAAAELSHLGPAYGREAIDDDARAQLHARDRSLLDALCRGRTRELLARGDDLLGQGRPSGLPVLATLAELATGGHGEILDHRLAPLPAPARGHVGLAAVRLSP